MRAMFHIHRFLRAFRDDTRGTVAVEAAIIMPFLFWAFMAMALFFDMYQTRSTTEKAAFTISDLLSRETAAINQDYLDSMLDMFNTISLLDEVDGMRVSVIGWDDVDLVYTLDWSHTVAPAGTTILPFTEDDVNTQLDGHLPELVPGERLIVLQSFGTYDPAINVGLGTLNMNTFVFTRPRFAPLLAWSDA